MQTVWTATLGQNKMMTRENIVTRKRGNCECIATWSQPFLITTPC